MRGLAVRRGGQMMPVKGVLTTCLMVVAAAVPEKIPIGAIFPPGTDDLQTALKYTFHIHNTNDTQARFKVEPVIDHVDSEDPFKIARTQYLQETKTYIRKTLYDITKQAECHKIEEKNTCVGERLIAASMNSHFNICFIYLILA